MFREPTRWLLSLYNEFLLGCKSNETDSACCRTERIPFREGREVCASKLNGTDFRGNHSSNATCLTQVSSTVANHLANCGDP